MPDPDDFDQQLRDLTSGEAKPPKFTELSAEERIRRLPGPPPPPPKLNRRNARKARQLRQPIVGPGDKPSGPGRARPRRGLSQIGGQPSKPVSQRRRRVVSAAKVVGIALAFAALLYGLHLLGLGPQ